MKSLLRGSLFADHCPCPSGARSGDQPARRGHHCRQRATPAPSNASPPTLRPTHAQAADGTGHHYIAETPYGSLDKVLALVTRLARHPRVQRIHCRLGHAVGKAARRDIISASSTARRSRTQDAATTEPCNPRQQGHIHQSMAAPVPSRRRGEPTARASAQLQQRAKQVGIQIQIVVERRARYVADECALA
jgi:hypothetical protein